MPSVKRISRGSGRAVLAAALLLGPLSMSPAAAFPAPAICTPDDRFGLSAVAPIRVEDAFYPPLPPGAVPPGNGGRVVHTADPDEVWTR